MQKRQNRNLTIDDTIQTVLETELSNAIDDYDVQNRASAIVMNVNTGAVLGMATTPQFDPNDPYNITEPKLQAILDNAGTALTEDDISNALKCTAGAGVLLQALPWKFEKDDLFRILELGVRSFAVDYPVHFIRWCAEYFAKQKEELR